MKFLRLCDLLSAHRDLNLLTHTIPLLLVTLLKDLPFFLAKSLSGVFSELIDYLLDRVRRQLGAVPIVNEAWESFRKTKKNPSA